MVHDLCGRGSKNAIETTITVRTNDDQVGMNQMSRRTHALPRDGNRNAALRDQLGFDEPLELLQVILAELHQHCRDLIRRQPKDDRREIHRKTDGAIQDELRSDSARKLRRLF